MDDVYHIYGTPTVGSFTLSSAQLVIPASIQRERSEPYSILLLRRSSWRCLRLVAMVSAFESGMRWNERFSQPTCLTTKADQVIKSSTIEPLEV